MPLPNRRMPFPTFDPIITSHTLHLVSSPFSIPFWSLNESHIYRDRQDGEVSISCGPRCASSLTSTRDPPSLVSSSELRDLPLQPSDIRPARITVVHHQLRDLLLPLDRGHVLYPRGTSIEELRWSPLADDEPGPSKGNVSRAWESSRMVPDEVYRGPERPGRLQGSLSCLIA